MKRLLSMKHLLLPIVFVLFALQGWGQLASWTGPWSGSTAGPVSPNTKDGNVSSAQMDRVTITASSSSARFSSSGWTSGGYLTIVITASTGYVLNLNGATVSFNMGCSSTGPASFTLLSSVNAYAAAVSTPNPLTTVQSATTGTQQGLRNYTLPSTGYNGLPSITFRVTGTGAGSSSGTGGPSVVTIGGTTQAVATQVKFFNVPATGAPATAIGSFTAKAIDADGTTVDATNTSNITLTKATGPGTISGTLTKAAVAGVASFSDIKFSTAGTYTISAASTGLTGVTSGNIVITVPGSAATDYFRSAQTGNWGDASSWQSSSDNSTWIAATLTPDNNAAAITILGSHNITVATNVTADNLVVAANGTLTVNTATTLTINAGTGTDLDVFGIVNNSGVITPTNAQVIVETGAIFNCLSGSPTAVGVIGNVGTGSITGNVTMQQNLTAQRAYRLLGHPFNANAAISALQPYVDITGSGSNLTAGNASAFNYTTGVWSAYTDATQTWNKNEALFLFVRGTPGQGVGQTTGTYTPSAPTISLTGPVNVGDLDYTVRSAASFSNGSAVGWNAIGNPYPAPIDVNAISNITAPGGSGASIYLWNATMGSTGVGIASGGYDFQTLGSPVVIPAYGAFFIKNVSGIDQLITFRESNKSIGTPVYAPFGESTIPAQSFLLTIADSLTYWDKLKISFGDQFSTASTDRLDMDKFSNINLDFYSLASDNKHLAINSRPVLQSATEVIALGLKTNQQRAFTVKASEVSLAQGSNLYLHDKYTNNWMKIANDSSYTFSVSADTASQGNNRFEVAMKGTVPSVVIPTPAPSALTVQAGPNPVKSILTITYASPETLQTNIRITDISGKTVTSINAGKVQSGVQQVAMGTWGTGVYVIQVNNGKETVTKKVVKE